MPKAHSSDEFTAADRRRLSRAMETTAVVRVYRRLEAVLFVAEGHSVRESALMVRTHRRNVERWVGRYLAARDPAALADERRTGRPRVRALTDRQLARLVATDPRVFGYQTATWTAPLLAAYCAERLHRAVSPRTIRRRLHALRYRWKRPRYRYAHRAAHLAQKKGLSAVA
jgi:transposase